MARSRWTMDTAHSSVEFRVRHMMLAKVHGRFDRWSGFLDYDPADLAASRVEVTIDASSIDTHEPERDEHLRSADFLDAAHFPTIAFVSRRVEKGVGRGMRVTGDLTIRGVTKEVTLDGEMLGEANDPWGKRRVAITAKTIVDRRDFGLTWNKALEAGGVLVGEEIEIELDVQAVREGA